jgi:hypothetical protein
MRSRVSSCDGSRNPAGPPRLSVNSSPLGWSSRTLRHMSRSCSPREERGRDFPRTGESRVSIDWSGRRWCRATAIIEHGVSSAATLPSRRSRTRRACCCTPQNPSKPAVPIRRLLVRAAGSERPDGSDRCGHRGRQRELLRRHGLAERRASASREFASRGRRVALGAGEQWRRHVGVPRPASVVRQSRWHRDASRHARPGCHATFGHVRPDSDALGT